MENDISYNTLQIFVSKMVPHKNTIAKEIEPLGCPLSVFQEKMLSF